MNLYNNIKLKASHCIFLSISRSHRPKSLTKDGFESQLDVNHDLGHLYLTNKLLDALKSSETADQLARVVNLVSLANYIFPPKEGIRFNDLPSDKYYNQWERYSSSKLANIVFSNKLNRSMKELI